MARTKYQFQKMYENWWLNKWVKFALQTDVNWRYVIEIELVGPPSFVYGEVILTFEDGSKQAVPTPSSTTPDATGHGAHNVFKPRKKDVIVYNGDLPPGTLAEIWTKEE